MSGFRLLSKDFLPNVLTVDHSVPEFLLISLLTLTTLLLAFFFYPNTYKPKRMISEETFQVHFEVETDEVTLFSNID